ncbi:hypothetical protein Taro_053228, partial [Colocasia esculenta]|nr:hypothetical protein [Colocasia esculenta]
MYRHMMMQLVEEKLVDVIIFDCFWYNMYLTGSPKVMGGHWNLLVLCNLGKSFNNNCSLCMILLDSLLIAEPLKVEPMVRRLVRDLYHTEGKLASARTIGSILLLLPQVPQQRDGEECGVFTLYYIYLFLKSAPTTFL